VCTQTAESALSACQNAAEEVYNLAYGRCLNITDSSKKIACLAAAGEVQGDSNDECDAQRAARGQVCTELKDGAYDPDYRPVNFTKPNASKQNPYFPLNPRVYTYFSYEKPGDPPIEKDVVTVTKGTRVISGVTCRVIHDVVTDLTVGGKNGQKTEDTTDWYALDKDGNVWYFGEIAQQFENNILVGIDGSWTTDKDGAKPGYNMLADLQIGKVYRQEFALGEAEDMARVMGFVEGINNLPVDPWFIEKLIKSTHLTGDHVKFLHTRDFSALDPLSVLKEQYENKYYAPGFGVVLIIAPDGIIEVLENVEEVE
jgi:hypothetical protein